MSSMLCIPRIELSHKRDYICKIIEKLELGKIEQVTEIPLKTDPTHKRIMIKIAWNKTPKSEKIKTRLIKKQPVQIVHDGTWYWKLMMSKGPPLAPICDSSTDTSDTTDSD